MSSRCLDLALLALCATLAWNADARTLRVCGDPDNLPFSHQDGSGFENRLAQLVADAMHAQLEYYWWPQRRGFLRNTLNARVCDLVIGIPAGVDLVRTTQPYYRSSYVFVQRDEGPPVESLDDARLRTHAIGLVLPGDDGAATPPGEDLARRGIVDNVHGYTPFGEASAAQRIVDDVANRRIDIGILWGPQAGRLAKAPGPLLKVVAVRADPAHPLRLEFDIAMGVRRDDRALAAELDEVIAREQRSIQSVLADFRVPRVEREAPRSDRR